MKTLLKHLPKDLSKVIKPIISDMEDGGFFGDDETVRESKRYLIKVSKANLNLIKPRVKKTSKVHNVSGKPVIDVDIAGYKIRFRETGKSGGASDAKSTQKQELASMWIIRRAINDNQRYNTWKDITNDPKWPELQKIYPDIDDEWLQGLYAQQKTMLREFSHRKFSEYSRDGGFMKFISDLVKNKYGISKKDTWNPADIWLIQDESKREKELEKVADGVAPKIEQLNEVMKKQFKQRQIIGVSLKKISGKEALWEEVNLGDVVFNTTDYKFEVDFIRCKLSSKNDGGLTSGDSIIAIKDKTNTYKFQMRPNSKGFSNQKLEPSQVGASAARLGKVPQDMFRPMIKEDYKMRFENNWRQYPQEAKTFNKHFLSYWDMFNKIYDNGVDTDTEKTKSAFKKAIVDSFANDDIGVATSKLMQLDFLSQLFALKKKKREELLTNMLFLAMKKGAKFGPFGKLY